MNKYFLLKSFNSKITDEDLIIELNDDENNAWLINYGCSLDNGISFKAIAYGDSKLVLEQSILSIDFNIYIFNKPFQKFIDDNVKDVEYQWINLEIYNSQNDLITEEYKILNIINPTDCLNLNKSDYEIQNEDEKRFIFYKMFIDENRINNNLGCIDFSKNIFVSDLLKKKIEENNFTSSAFIELNFS